MRSTDRDQEFRGTAAAAVRAWLESARVEAWQGNGEKAPSAPDHLEAAFEELEVAEHELRIQNDELSDLAVALETERQHYLELFEAAPDGYLVTDSLGVIRQANRAAHAFTSIAPGNLTGKPLAVLIDARYRSEFRAQLSRLTRLERLSNWEVDLVSRSGPTVPISISAMAIGTADAESVEIRWLLRDVRERRAAEESSRKLQQEHAARLASERAANQARFLAEAGRSFQQVLGSSKMARRIVEMAVPRMGDMCVLYLGETGETFRCAAITHHDPELCTRALAMLSRPLDLEAIDGPARVARTGETEIAALVDDTYLASCAPDHAQRQLLASFGPRTSLAVALHEQGRVVGVLWLINTTARSFDPELLPLAESYADRASVALQTANFHDELIRARDSAARANEEKARFLATLSHDFRTPLAAVLGYTDLLLGGVVEGVPEKAQEWVSRIRAGTVHQLALVDQLLSFTRIENVEETPRRDVVDLCNSITAAAEMIRVQAESAGLTLQTELPDRPLSITTDPGMLGQVLINLLSNALRFTSQGSIRVRLSREGAEAVIRVIDTGIGIPAHALAHVFDRFWQAEPSPDGTNRGLGLTIARRNTELLGGRIEVSSEVGRGTTFAVHLPVEVGS
jgi:PAS domain S-box-containing protein